MGLHFPCAEGTWEWGAMNGLQGGFGNEEGKKLSNSQAAWLTHFALLSSVSNHTTSTQYSVTCLMTLKIPG